MKHAPKIGDIVKFHAVFEGHIQEILGRVRMVSENDAYVECCGRVYTRYWDGLKEASTEEIVLWKFEQ